MAFQTTKKSSEESPEFLVSKRGLSSGEPLLVTVEEVLDGKSIKAKLVLPSLKTPAGTKVTVEHALAASDYRSLMQNIQGTDRIAPVQKGDLLCFNQAYINGGKAAVGMVTARTHDKMRGSVQALACMARLSRASVSSKGATQFVTIANTAKAMTAKSLDDVKLAWDRVLAEKLPGQPGFIVRFNGTDAGGKSWTLKKGEKIDVLLEDLDYNQVFNGPKAIIELIPTWELPSGRDQVSLDVDLRHETQKPVLGQVSKLFVFDEKRGRTGFLPSIVIIGNEEEFAFGGPTGKVIKAASGVQPCFRSTAYDPMKMPSNIRAFGGAPNAVQPLWNDEQVATREAEKVNRRGPDPEVKKPAASPGYNGAAKSNRYDDDDMDTGGRPAFGRR